MAPDGRVDYRYLLANERTFLAYVRTALALQVTGLAALEFLTSGQAVVRIGLGLVLVGAGSFVAVVGYRRWRDNDTAIRSGAEIPSSLSARPIAVAVMAFPLLAAILLTVF